MTFISDSTFKVVAHVDVLEKEKKVEFGIMEE